MRLALALLAATVLLLAGCGGTTDSHPASTISLCAVGEHGTILTTRDGGALWHGRHSGTWAFLTDVAFAGSRHGWIVGDKGTIFTTADGGQT